MEMIIYILLIIAMAFIIGICIVRTNKRGLTGRFGKYKIFSKNREKTKINTELINTIPEETGTWKIVIVPDDEKWEKIKQTEGYKQSKILRDEGESAVIKLENISAEQYFIGNAQVLRKLKVLEASIANSFDTTTSSEPEISV